MKTVPDASALPTWRKSTYSENNAGGCVEVSDGYSGGVPVRDSKAPHGPAIVFEPAVWSAFVSAVGLGQLLG